MISRVLKPTTRKLWKYNIRNLDKKTKHFVIELSSFQLDYIDNFKPNISIISNINNDHLNYHKTFDNYFKAKIIYLRTSKEDFLILNYDDENIKNYFKKKNNIKAKIIKISNKSSFSKVFIIKIIRFMIISLQIKSIL